MVSLGVRDDDGGRGQDSKICWALPPGGGVTTDVGRACRAQHPAMDVAVGNRGGRRCVGSIVPHQHGLLVVLDEGNRGRRTRGGVDVGCEPWALDGERRTETSE